VVQMSEPGREWLTVPRAAQMVCVSERTIWRRIRDRQLKAHRVLGDNIRIRKADLEAALTDSPLARIGVATPSRSDAESGGDGER